jgi:hypothetical protein
VRRVAQGRNQVNLRKLPRTALCAISVALTSSAVALGQNGLTTDRMPNGNAESLPPSLSPATADPPQGAAGEMVDLNPSAVSPRWTASAEFILWDRIGTVRETLVTTYPVPPPPPMPQLTVGQGTDRLYSDDLPQGFAGGPKVGLTYHADKGYDWEVSFFEIDGWSNTQSIATAADITPVFAAPGGFVQTTDGQYKGQYQNMGWDYATRLYNAEINLHWDLCSRVTMLAGVRWVNLWEDLQGTIEPSDRTLPFWETTTRNNLYGLQIGEDWKIFSYDTVSLHGLVKAGIFDNVADETTVVSIYRHPFGESASTNQLAFLGEIGVQCRCQLTQSLLLKFGYEAMCLQGLALAPGQIPETYSHSLPLNDIYVRALGINSMSGVFYHGASVGLEYVF